MITLVAGILLLISGVVLICIGVGAEGSIDIKTSFLTGKIKSGSAGLFCCLFGLVLVVIANAASRTKSMTDKLLAQKPLLRVIISAIMIMALLLIFIFFPDARILTAVIIVIVALPFGRNLQDLN